MTARPENYRLSHTAPPSALTALWQRVGHVIPATWRSELRRAGQIVHSRHLESSDVLLLSYPKSGSSWLRNMFAAIRAGKPIDPSTLAEWVPPLHHTRAATEARVPGFEGRVIRSHDAIDAPGFKKARRTVVLVRDPRAVAVSLHFHGVRRGATNTTVEDSARKIMSKSGTANLGSWQSHADRTLAASSNSNLVVRYEDLVASPVEVLTSVCDFLGWRATPATVEMAVESTRPDILRRKRIEAGMDDQNDPIGGVRKADADSWREECPPEAQKLIWLAGGKQMTRLDYLEA